MKSIMSSTTPVSTSPPPEDDGFWSEFKIGIVLAIIIIPLLIFLPIIVGVIFIAVRIHYRKMAVYRMSNRSTLSPGRVHSNMPSHLKRTSIVGSGDVIIDNPTIKWLTFPTPVPPANPPSERVPVPRQPTELDNPASPVREFYSYPRPRCRRISENVLYEPSDDIYTTLPEHGQQSELEPSFSPSIPLYQLSPSIDQRPQHPLPSSAMPIPQPQLTTSSGTQPQDPSSTGLLVMSVSPRVGSNGISNLREVRHEDRQRNPSSSRRFSDIDPGYETLTKFTGGPSLSMSPPTPMTEVSELPAKSQAEPLIRQTHNYDDEQQRPSVDQVTPRLMPQPHINEPLTVSTLPSDASLPHKYTKMALDSRQGSRENIQIRYDKGQITAVSNPMYSYPLHQSRSLTDLTHHRLEESLVQQLQAMKASIESNPKITGEEALPDSRITPGARITPEQSTAASSVIGPKSGINPRASTMPATPSVGIRSGINPEESTMPVQSATTSSVDIRSGINPEESTMPVQSATTSSVDIRSGINPEESTMPVQSAMTPSVDIRSGINPEESTMPVQSATTSSVDIRSGINPEESTMPVQSAMTPSVDIRSGINPEESTMPVQSAMTPSVDIRSGINPEESTMPVQSATTSSVDIRSGINPEESTMPVQSTTTPSVGIKSDVVSGGGAIYTYCIDV
jgi:hypothetical protein